MKFTRKRTQREYIHLIFQSLLVVVVMFLFMFVLKHYTIADASLGAIGATSLGSTAFLAFVAHDTAMARERRIISGYAIGIIIGVLGDRLMALILHCDSFHCQAADIDIAVAAISAMITMIAMVLTSSEHPPAVGIAIGLVLRQWDVTILLVVFSTVLVIAALKFLLRRKLLNLL